MKSVVYVEIDLEYCVLTYGVGDCPAVLGVDSAYKCFQSKGTCPVRQAFDPEIVTLRFGLDNGFLEEAGIECIPTLVDEPSYTPSTINLGQSMGQRASVTARFKDHQHNDVGFDKYRSERDYDPLTTGTFWGKFRARQPFLYGTTFRLIMGQVGQAIEDMDTQLFIVTSFDGPSVDGYYSITAKDPLKLADGDSAQAPIMSNGYLAGAVNTVATTLTLNPVGIGNAEYRESGKVAVGGKEIMSYVRDGGTGNDALTVLLAHFDNAYTDVNLGSSVKTVAGSSGSTTFSSTSKKWGTHSLSLVPAGYIWWADSADWSFGSGEFCVDVQFECDAVAGTIQRLSAQTDNPRTAAGSSYYIERTAGNVFKAGVAIGAVWYEITGTTQFTYSINPGWHHLKLCRQGNTLRLIIDGVSEGTVALSGSINNSTEVLYLGTDRSQTNSWLGRVDEFRISKGTSRMDEGVPTRAYNTISSDVLTVTRAQNNTVAATHSGQDRVQECLEFLSQDPVDIIAYLLTEYAGMPPDYIPIEDWQLESSLYLQRVYSALIAEPTSVKKLVDEIIEQAALALWWDSFSMLIRLQVLRSISTSAIQLSETQFERDSFDVKDQPTKRVTQVWCYYGQFNPLKKVDEADNYLSAIKDYDLQIQSDSGSASIKKIYSRWIAAGGRTTAARLCDIQIGRFSTAPRNVRFKMFRHGQPLLLLGDGARVTHRGIQDARGVQEELPIQITRLSRDQGFYNVEAEEMRFNVADNFFDRYIYIDSNRPNINIRDEYDDLYPEPDASTVVNFVISAGSTVYSNDVSQFAITVGDWPVGCTVNVLVEGVAIGRGGTSGYPGWGSPGNGGGDAGPAIYTRFPINLTIAATGTLAGGGGGGGGGAGGIAPGFIATWGGAGGIGAGTYNASSNDWLTPTNGGGSNGYGSNTGGQGGYPGAIGSAGGSGNGGSGGGGGNAGVAIDGWSYVTLVSNFGDLLGATIN